MIDPFKRNIDYLRVSVTERCNLRCFYCMPEEGIKKKEHNDILRDEDIVNAVKAAVNLGLKKIRLTGGEPLVRRGIYELIKKISNIDGVEEIDLTTNGLLLKNQIKRLKAAGIKRVNLSLDSLKPDVYKAITHSNVSLDYHAIIKELIAHDMLPIKINAVLLNGINDNEVGDFIELANTYDIHVRFIELMPIGHLNFNYNTHFISKAAILERHPALQFEQKHKIAEYYTVPGKNGKIGFINPMSNHFCNQCNRLRLTADGHLKPCLHTNEEISIKHLDFNEMVKTFEKAIHKKPEKHRLNDKQRPIHRSMHKIGG